VADYKIFIENTNPRIDCFYDANMMPHPKQTIVAAIERQIVQEPMDSRVEWLRAASRCLWNFLEAADSAPAPSMAIDLDRVLRTAPESVVQQIVGQFCAIEDEQNEPFRAKAKRENQEIEARITAAIHIRDELLTAMRCGNAAAD
jgi:hypothetical protein